MTTHREMIYARFERFWHWVQAVLIIFLLLTGFNNHGTFHLLPYETSGVLHVMAALGLIVLWIFAIFWHFTTGEWRQYIPTTKNVATLIHFYSIGMFTGAPHPVHKTRRAKHDPLQRLTYFTFKVLVSPVIWISGVLYLTYSFWSGGLGGLTLETVALVHTAAAFVVAAFLVVHLYMITTGETLTEKLRAMITGYDEVEDEPTVRR